MVARYTAFLLRHLSRRVIPLDSMAVVSFDCVSGLKVIEQFSHVTRTDGSLYTRQSHSRKNSQL